MKARQSIAKSTPGGSGPLGKRAGRDNIKSGAAAYAVRCQLRDGVLVTHSVHPDRGSAERVCRSLRWAGRVARVELVGDER
jgi:hypothetical protein